MIRDVRIPVKLKVDASKNASTTVLVVHGEPIATYSSRRDVADARKIATIPRMFLHPIPLEPLAIFS